MHTEGVLTLSCEFSFQMQGGEGNVLIRFSKLRNHVCVCSPDFLGDRIGRGSPLPMRKKFCFDGLE